MSLFKGKVTDAPKPPRSEGLKPSSKLKNFLLGRTPQEKRGSPGPSTGETSGPGTSRASSTGRTSATESAKVAKGGDPGAQTKGDKSNQSEGQKPGKSAETEAEITEAVALAGAVEAADPRDDSSINNEEDGTKQRARQQDQEDLNKVWPPQGEWQKQWEDSRDDYTIGHCAHLSTIDYGTLDEHAMALKDKEGRVLAIETDNRLIPKTGKPDELSRRVETETGKPEGYSRRVETRFADGRLIEQEFSSGRSPDGRFSVLEYTRSESDPNGASKYLSRKLEISKDDGAWKYTETGPDGTRTISHRYDSRTLEWKTTETKNLQETVVAKGLLDPFEKLKALGVEIPSENMIEAPLESLANGESSVFELTTEKASPLEATAAPPTSPTSSEQAGAGSATGEAAGPPTEQPPSQEQSSSQTSSEQADTEPPTVEGAGPRTEQPPSQKPSSSTAISEQDGAGSATGEGAGPPTEQPPSQKPSSSTAISEQDGGAAGESSSNISEKEKSGKGAKGGFPGGQAKGEELNQSEGQKSVKPEEKKADNPAGIVGADAKQASNTQEVQGSAAKEEGKGGGGADTSQPPTEDGNSGGDAGRGDKPETGPKAKEPASSLARNYDAELNIPSSPEEAEKQGFKPDPRGPTTDPKTGIETRKLTRDTTNRDGFKTGETIEFKKLPDGRQQAELTRGTQLKGATISERVSREIVTDTSGNPVTVTRLERKLKPDSGPTTTETIKHNQRINGGQSLEHIRTTPQPDGTVRTEKATTIYNSAGQPVNSSYSVETGTINAKVNTHEDGTITYRQSIGKEATGSDFPPGTTAILNYDTKGQLTSAKVIGPDGQPLAKPEQHPFVQGHIALEETKPASQQQGSNTGQEPSKHKPGHTGSDGQQKNQASQQQVRDTGRQLPENGQNPQRADAGQLKQGSEQQGRQAEVYVRMFEMYMKSLEKLVRELSESKSNSGGSQSIEIRDGGRITKVPVGASYIGGNVRTHGIGNRIYINSPQIARGSDDGHRRRGDGYRLWGFVNIMQNVGNNVGRAAETEGNGARELAGSAAH